MNKHSIEFRKKFPAWSKIRQDESSLGSLLFSKINESLEEVKLGTSRFKTQQKILENEQLLEVSDYYDVVFDASTQNQINALSSSINPSINGLIALASIDDYYSKLPDRVEAVSDASSIEVFVDYSSGEAILKTPEYLYIKIENIIFETNEYNFANPPSLIIRGFDFTGEPREEFFKVNDSGLFKSKYKYRKLTTLNPSQDIRGGSCLEYFGFNADIVITTREYGLEEVEVDYHLAGSIEDNLNFGNSVTYNNLIISLRKDGDDSYLDYMFRGYTNGQDYKTALSNITESDVYYILFSQILRDSSGSNIDVVSITYSKIYDRVLALDINKNLHFFKLRETDFARKEIQRTSEIDFNFYSNYQRCALNEEVEVDIFLQRSRGPIYKVFFARRTPGAKSDSDSEILNEFLKEDEAGNLVWGDEFYLFDGKNLEEKFLNFKNIRFKENFSETGQYDYYSFSFQKDTKNDAILKFNTNEINSDQFLRLIKLELEDKNQQTIFINDYSIMCESQNSEKTLSLNIQDAEDCSISLEGLENHLVVIKENQGIYTEQRFRFIKDYFYYDRVNGRVILFERTEAVTVSFGTLNFTFQTINKKNNSTSIDELALKHALIRSDQESISDFKDRLLMLLSKESKFDLYHIDDSFQYVTSRKAIDIGEISFQKDIENFEITSEYLIYKKKNSDEEKVKLKKFKFIKDMLEYLGEKGITVTIFSELNDVAYLKARNLRPFKLLRVRSNLNINNSSAKLPDNYVEDDSVFIHGENESTSAPSIDSLTNNNQYFLEEDSIYLTSTNLNRTITYSYKDWPIKLIWLPIKSIEVISEDFEVTSKDSNGYLTQVGAKLYNQILKKQNTYWGK